METIIDESFGNILFGDSRTLLQGTYVDDALMSHCAFRSGIQNVEVAFQAARNVVGMNDGNTTCIGNTIGPIIAMYIHEMGRIDALP